MQNKIQGNKFWRIASVILCVLCVGFIFSNSVDNAARSSDKSGAVVAVLQGIVDGFTDGVTVNEAFVRTAAHFSEFALLGFLILFAVWTFTPKYIRNIFIALFMTLAVAVTDEMLQMFSDGRVSDVADVAVDFLGSVTGMVFFVFIVNLPNIILSIKAFLRRRTKVG